ncbi:MAG TPA: hypothetical protein VIO95_07980 [Mycobacterium sp.]
MTDRRSQLFAAALCVVAIIAVAITVPTALARHRAGRAGSGQLAPGLAALTDQQLGELVPRQSDFPAGWTPVHTYKPWDNFGYSRYHEMRNARAYRPSECFQVALGLATGSFGVATISEHDPADPSSLPGSSDIRVEVGREFDPSVFDDMATRLPRCSHFIDEFGYRNTVRILEDVHSADGQRHLRYSVTSDLGTDYYSYSRVSRLILTAEAKDGHQPLLDDLFENTLRRILARANVR